MSESPVPPAAEPILSPQPPRQLPLPGVQQPAMSLQGRFVAAAQYTSVHLQLCSQLYPGRSILQLSQDERRILINETDYLLLQSRWRIESQWFAEHFATPQSGVEMAAPGTILGERPGASPQPNPGGYL
jgi:hypothetical protein